MSEASFEAGLSAYEAGEVAEALRHWQAAAQAGDPRAQYNLAVLLDEGRVVVRDTEAAALWYAQAAHAGYPPAQFNLGLMFLQGEGVRRDPAQARLLFQLAAQRGHPEACFNLGQMFAEGEAGLPQDYAQAVSWYRKAAEAGMAEAANNLAIRYAMGQGVARDDALAYQWFSIAAALGDPLAPRHRDRVAQELAPEAVVAAGRATQQWLEEHGHR